jgi:hypothetical protein
MDLGHQAWPRSMSRRRTTTDHPCAFGRAATLVGRGHRIWPSRSRLSFGYAKGRRFHLRTKRLTDALASTVAKKMRAAYYLADPLLAEAELEGLARSLERSHLGAAASLREGLAET